MFAEVTAAAEGAGTGMLVWVALWAADGRPRLMHAAVAAAVALAVACLVSLACGWPA